MLDRRKSKKKADHPTRLIWFVPQIKRSNCVTTRKPVISCNSKLLRKSSSLKARYFGLFSGSQCLFLAHLLCAFKKPAGPTAVQALDPAPFVFAAKLNAQLSIWPNDLDDYNRVIDT